MNARADNGQSDSVVNQSSGGKVTLRAQREKIMSKFSKWREIQSVKWLISFLTGQQTLNRFSVVVHAKNPHFLSLGGKYLTEPTVTW